MRRKSNVSAPPWCSSRTTTSNAPRSPVRALPRSGGISSRAWGEWFMPGNRKNILQTLAGYVNVGAPSLPVPSMESDPLGVGGAIAGAPEYGLNYNNLGNAMAQQALQQSNALNVYNKGPGSGWMPLGPAREATPFVTVQPLRVFIEARTKL